MLTLYSELTLSNKFILTINLLSPLHLLPGKRMDQPREVWRAPHTKKGSQSFGLTPSPKTAATYSPTVTQYHRRDEA